MTSPTHTFLQENSPLNDFARTGAIEHVAALMRMVVGKGLDVNRTYASSGLPLLALAAGRRGNLDAALILIAAGGNPSVALEHAYDEQRVKAFLNAGANPNHVTDRGMTTLMRHCAGAATSSVTEVKGAISALLDAGADVNAVDPKGYQAIHHALRTPSYDAQAFDRMTIVKMLVERGADLGATTSDGTTVMDLAVRCGSAGVVDHLLEKGYDVGDALSDPSIVRRLLEAGCVKGKTTMLERVIRLAGADVLNTVVEDETFPVWTEAVGKHKANDPAMMRVVSALVDAGADLQMKSLHLNGTQRLQVGWYLNKRPVLQERVALMEAADEAMAEAPEPAPSRARARL